MSSAEEAGPSTSKKGGKGKKNKTKEERTGVENAWSVNIPKFQKGDMKHSLVDVTDFSVNFPEYREPYLKTSLPILKKIMKVNIFLDLTFLYLFPISHQNKFLPEELKFVALNYSLYSNS